MNKKEIIKGGYKFAEKEISKDKNNFTVIYNIKSRKYSSKSLNNGSNGLPENSIVIFNIYEDGYYEQVLQDSCL